MSMKIRMEKLIPLLVLLLLFLIFQEQLSEFVEVVVSTGGYVL